MSRWPCGRVSASRKTTSPNAAGFDTDALASRLAAWADLLGDGPWTDRFPFRPTVELVARHLYGEVVHRSLLGAGNVGRERSRVGSANTGLGTRRGPLTVRDKRSAADPRTWSGTCGAPREVACCRWNG
jgi:hypothetical protein